MLKLVFITSQHLINDLKLRTIYVSISIENEKLYEAWTVNIKDNLFEGDFSTCVLKVWSHAHWNKKVLYNQKPELFPY